MKTKIKLRVTASTIYWLNPTSYQNAWKEYYIESNDDYEEGDDIPPMDEDWAVSKFEEGLADGDEDMGIVMEAADIEVKKVD